MKNIELNVDGMHCGGCSSRINRVLGNLDGVKSADANFENGIVKVSYDEGIVGLKEIKESIVDAGFSVKG